MRQNQIYTFFFFYRKKDQCLFETIHRVTKLKETSSAKSRNSKERKNSFRLNNFPYLIYLGQRSRTVSNRLPLVMGRMEFAFKVEFPTSSNLSSKYPELCDNRTQWAGDLDKDLGLFTYRDDCSGSLVTYKHLSNFIDETKPYGIQPFSTIQENLLPFQ